MRKSKEKQAKRGQQEQGTEKPGNRRAGDSVLEREVANIRGARIGSHRLRVFLFKLRRVIWVGKEAVEERRERIVHVNGVLHEPRRHHDEAWRGKEERNS